jgi:regulator-associated protein of mTOR
LLSLFIAFAVFVQIWVFNRDYTQYMPLLVTELQRLISQPGLCVFDCDNAGHLLPFFAAADEAFADIGHGSSSASITDGMHPSYKREWIVLAACGPHEELPVSPEFPADLFTACLTTPIKVALRHAIQVLFDGFAFI